MICFKNNRPALLVGECLVTDYGTGWLVNSLHKAAERAGTTIPFCTDIISSIECYLEENCPLDVLPLQELYRRVKAMLRAVGLQHLAETLPTLAPPATVNLPAIAEKSPLLLFFAEELDQAMGQLRTQGFDDCCFTGKKECVLLLQGHKKWTHASQKMLDDLEFILSRYKLLSASRVESLA
ncbi:MAG: hypothetical protein RSE01_07655 [Akkermansia sp.]